MKRTRFILIAVLALAALATTAQAQSVKWTFEGAGLYTSLSGDDFDNTDAGMGFDLQGRYQYNSKWSFGGGLMRETHGIDGVSDDAVVLGFLVEPRFHFRKLDNNLMPYATLRVAYLKNSLETGGSDYEASGNLIGLGGGVGYAFSPNMTFGGSLTFNAISFGDVEIDGTSQDGTDTSGNGLTFRFSFAYSFR